MRIVIICFMSLLLAVVGAERNSLPPSRFPPPPRTSSPLSIEHGDLVHYQADHGPHVGLVVGSPSYPEGHFNIAPLARHSAHPPKGPIIPLTNQVVVAKPNQIKYTGYSSPFLASDLEWHHDYNTPAKSQVKEIVDGLPVHRGGKSLRGK